MDGAESLIGIDVGGTRIKAVRTTAEGREIGRCDQATPEDREALIAAVERIVERLGVTPTDRGAVALGLASPGLATADGRSIRWMRGRMDFVEGLVWERELGWPSPVPVLNDAHAATLGEAWLGAARGFSDVVLLTLGTGVGGGILVGGKLLRGHLGRAGHLGHLCLDIDGPPDICDTPGSLEEAIADCGVVERSHGRFATTRDLVVAASGGDAEAQRLWSRALRSLACGLATIINAVDPQIIVLGGGIAAAGPALFEPLRELMAEVEWRPTGEPVPIVAAELGGHAGALGAAREAGAVSGL